TQNRIDEAKTNILQNQKIAEKEQEISTRYEEAKAQKAEAWKRLEDSGKVLDELNEKGVSRGKKTAYLSLGIIFLIFALLAVVTSQSFVFYFGNIYKSVAFYCMIAAVIFAIAAILFIILRLRLGGDQTEKIKAATAQTVEAREAYTLAEQKEKELFEQLEETGKLVEQNMENTHEVAAMEEIQKIDRERLDIINKTKMYLEKAKQELSVHYLDKMRRYFDKYIDQVIGDANVKMDSEFRIMIEKEGSYRSSKNQSTGMQDILNLCARFALVESLYEEEKPCIILDDVMNNMDDDNSDKMMKAIESLSENYQVIYLTCHTSRVIKKIKETEKNGLCNG
ncbi:MAG: hypothetical protein K6F99_08665, partial [Lachnospiraceae bacterium]|nr:hypothetical protein [Lachnospiraceae bacterium]